MLPEGKLKDLIQNLPSNPGVYRYFDKENELIYVGKAKDLRKRVSSYFSRLESLDNKTRRLVSLINNIEFTIVNTEFDALILENNLIKEYQPKYNILLKDDKTYPYIYISYERFPKVVTTRRLEPQLGKYYGPYTSVSAMNNMVDLITKLFQIRTCNLNLSEKNIEEKKFKVCLEYHLGNCKGPCEGLEDELEYNEKIKQIHHVLKGNIGLAKSYFKNAMQEASSNLEFEKAQNFKYRLDKLDSFHSSSAVVHPSIEDLEVYSIVGDEKNAVVNFMKVSNGLLLQSKIFEVKKKLEETDEEIISLAIINTRQTLPEVSQEVLCNVPVEFSEESIHISVPQRGDKKKLLDLSIKNAQYRLDKINEGNRDDTGLRVMQTLQKDLQLKELPVHIECFDNSNFQGTDAVSAMVCFKNAKPSKKDYRHFNVKTVQGPDDFATMYEAITRRYKRLSEEGSPLPQLIIVDGGKGQLSSACNALIDLNLYGSIPIIGIAKNLEEIFFPGDEFPLYIDKKSESLRLIQYMRDEAHRFGISHHRNRRSKSSIKSQLTEIPDVGSATIEKLLKKFKSISRIKQASLEDLAAEVGLAKAEKIQKGLK